MRELNPRRHSSEHGFTLVELAVTLLILTILAAMLLVPLSGREELRKRKETQATLADIREALIGFAILYKRLPCPTREADPRAPAYGLEESPPCTAATEGYLPWRTLGVPPFDAWGAPRTAAGDAWKGYWRYRVDPGFSQEADSSCPSPRWPIGPSTRFETPITIVDSAGNPLTSGSSNALTNPVAGCPGELSEDRRLPTALVYSPGPNGIPDGENASYEASGTIRYQQDAPGVAFDDVLVWIGKPLLIARMAAAGSL